ncbi:hypothetical protein FA15DRAFT_475473 [Coprinopsis marcescibilis]|uniref:DNA2/NAM7 helicase-like C-terminal domain-containing protein n=1 Tax=Coprinopsis marcescibilis TaxID=230819 RepID=A0A5C3KRS3_COPMA|nr:hypothetical protein FA15DRAFT_475473 [Coprinopsis marcescibilis]
MGGRRKFGVSKPVLNKIKAFIFGLSDAMLRIPQKELREPLYVNKNNKGKSIQKGKGKGKAYLTADAISLSLLRLKTWSAVSDQFGYESHVHGEAAVAAALVACIRYCSPEDDIFIATPHRVQREAVRSALGRLKIPQPDNPLEKSFGKLSITDGLENVTVDTIERLQGSSEASFVICLFSLPDSYLNDLGFLLERRRLNVAISRAKNLCVLVTSSQVLCPPVTVFSNEQTAKGFAFLKAYEDRAWSCDLSVNIDDV